MTNDKTTNSKQTNKQTWMIKLYLIFVDFPYSSSVSGNDRDREKEKEKNKRLMIITSIVEGKKKERNKIIKIFVTQKHKS